MRARTLRLACALFLVTGSVAALSLALAQPAPPAGPTAGPKATAAPAGSRIDLSHYSPTQRQMAVSAQRGAAWLQRVNRLDGRFVPGLVPALRRPLEGDHYLRQAGAALALARAARFFADDRGAALARQAILTLLLDTEKDPQDAHARRSTFPPSVVSRLGAAGLLVAAIHELPAPGEDLLSQADELCAFIRRQQTSDGALQESNEPAGKAGQAELSSAGLALYGLLRSQQHRPEPWKLEIARKGCAYYQAVVRSKKVLATVPAMTAAFTETYLLGKDQALAEVVFDLNDWLCTLQYVQIDPRQIHWYGGFMGWADDRPAPAPPGADSAPCAESLADACRVARVVGDLRRHARYQQALEHALQFLMTLQYNEANTQHFADWYRAEILGGFYGSHQDGTLRLDYTQHAVGALLQYLASAERP